MNDEPREGKYSLPLMDAYYGTKREMESLRRGLAYHRAEVDEKAARLAVLEAEWAWMNEHRADDIAAMLAHHEAVKARLMARRATSAHAVEQGGE